LPLVYGDLRRLAAYPLVHQAAAAPWMDNRIVEFVQAYLSMGKKGICMRDRMVEHPIAHVRFPDFAADASLEWQGQKFYFIGEMTHREFEKRQGIGAN
jgi:hypothetical protein